MLAIETGVKELYDILFDFKAVNILIRYSDEVSGNSVKCVLLKRFLTSSSKPFQTVRRARR